MNLTAELLTKLYGCSQEKAAKFLPGLQQAFELAEINTTKRAAMFLAQIGHESGRLQWTTELWGPTVAQKRYSPPSLLSKQLGNTNVADGYKYRGRGLIQLTGKSNYSRFTQWLQAKVSSSPDFVTNPDLVASLGYVALSAAWYWMTNKLNVAADAGDVKQATKIINGGTNGLAERQELYIKALGLLE